MQKLTAPPSTAQGGEWPIDETTMRAAVQRAAGDQVLTGEQLAELAHQLRGHLQCLIPTAERLVADRPSDTGAVAAVDASVRWARKVLNRGPSDLPLRVAVRDQARALLPLIDLCVHMEAAR